MQDAPLSGSTLCENCDAVCCRLTVVLQDGDRVAPHMTTIRDGLRVMARDEDGWCVALDSSRMRCGCYETRPQVCRQFAMAGRHCLEARADYRERTRRGIPLQLH